MLRHRRWVHAAVCALARPWGAGEGCESLRRWVGPVGARRVGTPEAISRGLARGRRPGPADPWMPPWMARWMRSPGCRPYAALLARALRAAGHSATVVVGASREGAHAWVECAGRAFDLRHPGGAQPDALAGAYPLRTRLTEE